MTETARPTLSGLLDQLEAIGGPEQYGPVGVAILIALWRKSSKLGWMQTFQMTNSELMVQTGISTRKTLNDHRAKLVEGEIIAYVPPPNGSSRGTYRLKFDLFAVTEPVTEPVTIPVTISNSFSEPVTEPVTELNSSGYSPSYTVLKDFTTITTTTAEDTEFGIDDELEPDPQADGMIELLNAYCKMHGKFDIHVSPNERLAMGKMVAGGTPNPFTIRTMASLLEAKRQREGARFKLPKSFLYYVEGIEEAWANHQATERPDDVPSGQPAPESTRRLTKQQQEIAELEKFIEEERRRGSH